MGEVLHPTKESHRLTAHPNDAVTDAKVVLQELCAGDPERELACLDELVLSASARPRERPLRFPG